MDEMASLTTMVNSLIAQDKDLGSIVDQYGYPPNFFRQADFANLILIILEQQVSLASARAAFKRLQLALKGEVNPDALLRLQDEELKTIGFSRQKANYSRGVARAIQTGELPLNSFHSLDDETVRQRLTQLKGIGIWSANIYLMMCLHRADIWPRGDIALEEAIKQIKGLAERPKGEHFEHWGNTWKPYRTAAAFLLWHYYLSVKKVPSIDADR